MKFSADIKFFDKPDKAYRCLIAEKEVKTERSNFEVIKEKDHVLVKIKAKDASALRATFNSIMKLLNVYEKVKEIK